MTDKHFTRTMSFDLQDLIEMIDSEKFAEILHQRIKGIKYDADMIHYDVYDENSSLEIKKLHLELDLKSRGENYFDRIIETIADRHTAALALGRAILDTLETVFIEPRFLDGYGD